MKVEDYNRQADAIADLSSALTNAASGLMAFEWEHNAYGQAERFRRRSPRLSPELVAELRGLAGYVDRLLELVPAADSDTP